LREIIDDEEQLEAGNEVDADLVPEITDDERLPSYQV